MNNPIWLKRVLLIAGLYNIIFGIFTILEPSLLFGLIGIADAPYPFVWEMIGMINAVFGIGYVIGSINPIRNWPVLFVGFLSKLFGSIGFLYFAYRDQIEPSYGYNVFTNDIVWLFPLGYALFLAYLDHINEVDLGVGDGGLGVMMGLSSNQHGENLQSISQRQPVMLIFLRQFGCTFCREALQDLSKLKNEAHHGKRIVLVHMTDDDTARQVLGRYCLQDLDRISDPGCHLYKAFGLRRGNFKQLFGIRNFIRGINAGLFKGNFVGALKGDGFRMPGIFIIYKNAIIHAYYHKAASTRPDYDQLASCPVVPSPVREHAHADIS